MALNWADSSDDEDEAFLSLEHNPPVPGAEEEEEHEPSLAGDNNDDERYEGEQHHPPVPKPFIFPDRPPYTAFVGNLAFSITEPNQLEHDVQALVQQRFPNNDTAIVITTSRVATDRQTGKPKGFGYVEVETLEQLKLVLELNDGKSIIAGRTIHLDVAQPSQQQMRNHTSSGSFGGGGRSQSFNSKNGGSGEIDGSKFMGGRYNRQDSRGSDRGGRGGSGGDRNDRSGSFRSQGSNSGGGAAPTGQRPSLKLVPRGVSNVSRSQSDGSSNSIFGGGKARDVGTWDRGAPRKEDERRQSQRKDRDNSKDGKDGKDKNIKDGKDGKDKNNKDGKDKNYKDKDNKGGGERRRPSRQSSTGSRGSNNKGEKKKEESKKAAAPTLPTVPAALEPVAAAPAPATKKVVNKFAALDFGDSDDE